jgi:hypothetical protein
MIGIPSLKSTASEFGRFVRHRQQLIGEDYRQVLPLLGGGDRAKMGVVQRRHDAATVLLCRCKGCASESKQNRRHQSKRTPTDLCHDEAPLACDNDGITVNDLSRPKAANH